MGGSSRVLTRVLFLAALVLPRGAVAAPSITRFLVGPRPTAARVGEPVMMSVRGLAAPVRVFFSNGTSPTVEATPVVADLARGVVMARVPAGAMTGTMKVTAAGFDSPVYYFTVAGGTFVQGTDVVSGVVDDGTYPVAGAAVVILRLTGSCDNDFAPHDFTTTDANGAYTLHGTDGEHLILFFPP